MNERPIVSVVMAAYNAARFVRESIESVLSQTCKDFELIVVNDGSRDDTASVVQAFSDPRVQLVTQVNRGQSAALNLGVKYASGAYIKFLDADDILNPVHLQAQLDALQNQPQCLASCRWGYFVSDASHPSVCDEHVHRDFEDPLEWIVTSLSEDEGMMGAWMWLIPRSVWDNCGGWNEQISLNNDFDFSIRLLLSSNGVRFAPAAVYAYRKGLASSLSGSRGRRAMESAFQTTDLGTRALLDREDSERIRRIAADRFQSWQFRFYPEFPDLAHAAECRIRELGGSSLPMEGGRLCRALAAVFGWRCARQLQTLACRIGWERVQAAKARRRLHSIR